MKSSYCCICGKEFIKDDSHYKKIIIEERKIKDNPAHKYDMNIVSRKYLDICDICIGIITKRN